MIRILHNSYLFWYLQFRKAPSRRRFVFRLWTFSFCLISHFSRLSSFFCLSLPLPLLLNTHLPFARIPTTTL
ncbi:unnamed protein product [Coffea canephora]|uniref:Uncharacterized protein n=1 Tax=Coffea canephora TaxID=49390 RepID=A0A068UFH6_COFCA|nr:unnamed protein product [Coffea canephora]